LGSWSCKEIASQIARSGSRKGNNGIRCWAIGGRHAFASSAKGGARANASRTLAPTIADSCSRANPEKSSSKIASRKNGSRRNVVQRHKKGNKSNPRDKHCVHFLTSECVAKDFLLMREVFVVCLVFLVCARTSVLMLCEVFCFFLCVI
jgi:hypothetical protein